MARAFMRAQIAVIPNLAAYRTRWGMGRMVAGSRDDFPARMFRIAHGIAHESTGSWKPAEHASSWRTPRPIRPKLVIAVRPQHEFIQERSAQVMFVTIRSHTGPVQHVLGKLIACGMPGASPNHDANLSHSSDQRG